VSTQIINAGSLDLSGTSSSSAHTLLPYKWSAARDKEAQRTFTIAFRIQSNDPRNDGPWTVMNTPGLFLPGQPYNLGNDNDHWAWCTGEMTVTPDNDGEPSYQWTVEQTFSTTLGKRCQYVAGASSPYQYGNVGNPVLEPPIWNGNSVKTTKEFIVDNLGNSITNSAWEQIRGQNVEWDVGGKTQIKITLNVSCLEAGFWASLIDTVNVYTL